MVGRLALLTAMLLLPQHALDAAVAGDRTASATPPPIPRPNPGFLLGFKTILENQPVPPPRGQFDPADFSYVVPGKYAVANQGCKSTVTVTTPSFAYRPGHTFYPETGMSKTVVYDIDWSHVETVR